MKKLLLSLTFACAGLFAQAQDQNDAILTIDENNYSVEEFLHVYNKNRDLAQQLDPKSMDEYMDLFVNFKLKVLDAEANGLDTSNLFTAELVGYRNQLSKPYLEDREVEADLLQEAYQRMKLEVRASHLLIKVGQSAAPKDTLKAYNTAMMIHGKLKNGSSFEDMAIAFSEDPSVKQNKGDLGYFSALSMVYPFETAAYTTSVGEFSRPVRTNFGYHILKIIDKRPNPGRVRVSHIMVKHPKEETKSSSPAEIKKKIDELYAKVVAGDDFAELAKSYSEDKQTAREGGMLPWFGTNKMVKEFEDAAFALKEVNEVSAPIKTSYGWHIIKLIENESINSFEKEKAKLRKKLQRNDRAYKKQKVFVDKLRNEYKYTLNKRNFDKVIKLVQQKNFMNPDWDLEKNTKYYKKELFRFASLSFTQKDFVSFLRKKMNEYSSSQDKKKFINVALDNYVDLNIIKYENAILESKYIDFRMLLQEYHDGMLLYEISKRLVWDKASSDTTGLQAYYEINKDSYMFGSRLDAGIYTCANEKLANKAAKYLKKGKSTDWITEKLNKKSSLNFSFEKALYEKGDHEKVDAVEWTEGVSTFNHEGAERISFVYVEKILSPEHKTFNTIRGMVISDYQKYLELEWLKGLKTKHEIQINEAIFEGVKAGKYNQ